MSVAIPQGRSLVVFAVACFLIGACSTTDEPSASESTTATLGPGSISLDEESEAAAAADPLPLPLIETAPGELVWLHPREPSDLHADDPDNASEIVPWIHQGLVEGLFGVAADLTWYPELLAGEPEVTINRTGSVVIDYELRPGLTWSDGTALTADDVAYTHRILVEGCEGEADGSIIDASATGCEYEIASRSGYELVTDFDVIDPQRFSVQFASFYAGWRGLYGEVFAAHAYGEDAFAVNQNLRNWRSPDGVLPSSGPLQFDAWERGSALRLVRNDAYHGSTSPDVERPESSGVDAVLLAFVDDPELQAELLASGDAHLLIDRVGTDVAELAAVEGVSLAVGSGAQYEQWAFNVLNPHLAKPEVREAIAYALDKAAIVEAVFAPIVGPQLSAEGLGNVYWMPNHPAYEDHQSSYRTADPEAAARVLGEAGYTGGTNGWTHPDDGRLQLRVGTTAGDEIRDRTLELAQDQLAAAGIEVVVDSKPGGLFLTEGPFAPDAIAASLSDGRDGDGDLWDIAQFSWASGPWPGPVSGAFRSDSSANPYGHTSPEFDVAASDCDGVTDDTERAACYNTLDQFLTTLDEGSDGLIVVPISRRPQVMLYSGTALSQVGVLLGGRNGGPLVTIGDTALAS
ncbi:MAG: ABC transporter substrate-binding protein [Actinomycetota bacterium]